MGIIGKLLGSEKALSETVKAVSNGLDSLVYTEEEKAEDFARSRINAQEMIVEWMSATQGQNLARRVIALSVVSVWLLTYLIAIVSGVVSIWSDNAILWVNTSDRLTRYADDMSPIIMLIMGFYFAAPHMSDFAKVVTERMRSKNNGK